MTRRMQDRLASDVCRYVAEDHPSATHQKERDGKYVHITYPTRTGKVVATLFVGEGPNPLKMGSVVEEWQGFTYKGPVIQRNVAAAVAASISSTLARSDR